MALNLPQRARIATGLSQVRFATLLGVSRSVIERWERGGMPTGAAQALLRVIVDHPGIVIEVLTTDRVSGSDETSA